MQFGKMIKAARLKRGLTIQQASKGIVSFGAWAMWERGERRPDVDHVKPIARVLKLDIREVQEAYCNDRFSKAKRSRSR